MPHGGYTGNPEVQWHKMLWSVPQEVYSPFLASIGSSSRQHMTLSFFIIPRLR